MSVEVKEELMRSIKTTNADGSIEIIKTKYEKYNYFTLKLKAEKNKNGEIKKIAEFPLNWVNIKQRYNPSHNAVALICGKKSGIFVVDYDNYVNFDVDSLKYPELKNNYEKTTKGYHCFFKWNSSIHEKIGSRNVKEHNIDFLSDGKCVFTNPTSYKDEDGKKYNYTILSDEPLKTMSEDLINYFKITYLNDIVENNVNESDNEEEEEEEKKEINIDVVMNETFKTNFIWSYIADPHDNKYKIVHNGSDCLVKKGHKHSTPSHSCLFLNKGTSYAYCFRHGKKKLLLKEYPNLKKIKQNLGIIEPKVKAGDEKNNDFEILVYSMLEDSEKNKYKKEDGMILKQVNGVPTYFEEFKSYGNYLDFLFSEKDEATYKIFRKKVNHKHQLEDYLKTYNDSELPFIKRDPHIYSFNNGFLNIKTMDFTVFNKEETYDICSSLYFKEDFDINLLNQDFKEIKIPLIDKLLKYHIEDDEIYNILLCLVGRLFFKVGELDNWQCMPFLKGQGNTGKSTFMEIIESLFDGRDVGVIGSNHEKTFGLQALYEKRFILSQDIPKGMNDKLDATTFQKMVSGEKIPVPRKNRDPKYVVWSPSMLWGGNFLPDYSDKSGSVSRRLAIINMGKRVKNKDASLKSKIIKNERLLFFIKIIKAYHHYLKYFGNTVFEDWGKKFNIEYFDKEREEFKSENDYLYAFLIAPPNANKTKSSNIWIEYKEGVFTNIEKFKKSFKAYAKYKHNVNNYKWSNTSDMATLEGLGYTVKTIHICASCGKKANKGCCPEFIRKNRRKRVIIENMLMRNGFEENLFEEDSEGLYEADIPEEVLEEEEKENSLNTHMEECVKKSRKIGSNFFKKKGV